MKAGPLAGKTISLASGESVVTGRASERAQFAVPHDNLMSGLHFAVEYGLDGCRLVDKKSTNGTYLNGARIREAMLLANGDEIKSGQTLFVVGIAPDALASTPSSGPRAAVPDSVAVPRQPHAPANNTSSSSPATLPAATSTTPARPGSVPPPSQSPAPLAPPRDPSVPPALVIGGWAFHKIPERWHIQEGLCIQQVVKDAFPASIAAMEEPLGPGITLAKYVDEQSKMFRENVYQPNIGTAATPTVSGSEETSAIDVHFSSKDGPSVCMRRVYARTGSIIGVLTLTALEKDFASVRPVYDFAIAFISFSPAK
ncbi:MAG: FHA domain-containing protein [Candidatus Acidiferrum sp.]